MTESSAPPDSLQLSGAAVLELSWAVPAARRAELDAWYDEEHLREVAEVQGVLGARRFARHDAPFSAPTDRTLLVQYQLADETVLASPAFRRLSASPNARATAVTSGLRMERRVYRQIRPTPAVAPARTPIGGGLFHVLFGVDTEVVDAFQSWYDEEHLPAVSEASAVLGARRFAQAQGPAGVQFCAIYELTGATVVDTAEFREAGRRTPRRDELGDRIRAHVQVWTQAFPPAGALEIP